MDKIFHFILGNQSGDADSVASALALASAWGEHFIPLLNFSQQDLALRGDLVFLFDLLSINPKELHFEESLPSFFTQAKEGKLNVILVDHNKLAPSQVEWKEYVDQIIDHHVDEKVKYPHLKKANKLIDKVGSCATLITEIISLETYLSKKLACLLLAPILLDTANLTDTRKVTVRDVGAAELLKERAGGYYSDHFYRDLIEGRGDVKKLSLKDLLKKDLKIYQEGDFSYGIASFPRGVVWEKKNACAWHPVLANFLVEKDLKFLLVLQWIGEEKAVLLYTPYPEIKMKLLSQKVSEALFSPEAIQISPDTVLLKLKEPLARKALQPRLHAL